LSGAATCKLVMSPAATITGGNRAATRA
jgi:hypothetical protein